MTQDAIVVIAMALVKYGPELARALVALFQKTAPTAADWEVVFALAEKPLEDPDVAGIPPKVAAPTGPTTTTTETTETVTVTK